MSTSPKKVRFSPFKERLFVFIGSVPMITVLGISFVLMYQDYVLNDYNFLGKSWHLSNVEKTSYDVEIPCIDSEYLVLRNKYPSCAPKKCFRYFTDFLISDGDGKVLLNMAQKGWLQGEDTDSSSILSIEKGTVKNGKSITKLKEYNIKFQF